MPGLYNSSQLQNPVFEPLTLGWRQALGIFWLQFFVFIILKNPGKKNSGSYYSKKKSACGGLLLLHFSQKAKFGLSGGRFFNKILVFALKYP